MNVLNGVIVANNGFLTIDVRDLSSLTIQLLGTWTATLQFEFTVDGTNWYSLNMFPNGGTSPVTSATANGVWRANVGGMIEVRVRCSAFTSGTANVLLVAMRGNIGNPAVGLLDGLADTTDSIKAVLATDVLMNGSSEVSHLTAIANVNASQTDSQIVAAVANKKIRVLSMVSQCGGTATNLTFNSKPGGAGTAISPTFQNGANGGEVLPFSPIGHFDTNTGEGLTVTTGAGSTTGISVKYILV